MDTARKLDPAGSAVASGTHALSLQVGDAGAQSGTTAVSGLPFAPAPSLRLRCEVELQPPRIRSSRERRLQLRDSLLGGDASRNAGTLARDPHFWDFLEQISFMAYEDEIDTRRARHFINRVCGVNGRYDFEHCSDAALRYFTLIEQPFLDWLLAGDAG